MTDPTTLVTRGRPKRQSLEDRFWSHVDRSGDGDCCWPWKLKPLKESGYGRFAVSRRKSVRAHRMAWELANGPIPKGMDVLHKCDNRICVRHLFLGTQLDNMQDRDRKGRQASGDRSGARTMPWRIPRGSAHALARLDETKVSLIKDGIRSGKTQRAMAKEFMVSEPTISHIVAGRTWRHVA